MLRLYPHCDLILAEHASPDAEMKNTFLAMAVAVTILSSVFCGLASSFAQEDPCAKLLSIASSAPGDKIGKRFRADEGVDCRGSIGETPLMAAALGRNIPVLRRLIKKGANINAQDADLESVLRYAIEGGDYEVVRLVLKSGADTNAEDSEGRTPLMAATLSGRIDLVGLLLSHGSDLQSVDHDGDTVLTYAIESSDYSQM